MSVKSWLRVDRLLNAKQAMALSCSFANQPDKFGVAVAERQVIADHATRLRPAPCGELAVYPESRYVSFLPDNPGIEGGWPRSFGPGGRDDWLP